MERRGVCLRSILFRPLVRHAYGNEAGRVGVVEPPMQAPVSSQAPETISCRTVSSSRLAVTRCTAAPSLDVPIAERCNLALALLRFDHELVVVKRPPLVFPAIAEPGARVRLIGERAQRFTRGGRK